MARDRAVDDVTAQVPAHFLGADFIHKLHCLNDAQCLVGGNFIANLDKSRLARSGRSIERSAMVRADVVADRYRRPIKRAGAMTRLARTTNN